jgi:hypothetical protein
MLYFRLLRGANLDSACPCPEAVPQYGHGCKGAGVENSVSTNNA